MTPKFKNNLIRGVIRKTQPQWISNIDLKYKPH